MEVTFVWLGKSLWGDAQLRIEGLAFQSNQIIDAQTALLLSPRPIISFSYRAG